MSKQKMILVSLLSVAGFSLYAVPVERVVFNDGFAEENVSDATLPEYGWSAHYGAQGLSFFPVPEGYAKEAQPYIRYGTHILDNKPGDEPRSKDFSGNEP